MTSIIDIPRDILGVILRNVDLEDLVNLYFTFNQNIVSSMNSTDLLASINRHGAMRSCSFLEFLEIHDRKVISTRTRKYIPIADCIYLAAEQGNEKLFRHYYDPHEDKHLLDVVKYPSSCGKGGNEAIVNKCLEFVRDNIRMMRELFKGLIRGRHLVLAKKYKDEVLYCNHGDGDDIAQTIIENDDFSILDELIRDDPHYYYPLRFVAAACKVGAINTFKRFIGGHTLPELSHYVRVSAKFTVEMLQVALDNGRSPETLLESAFEHNRIDIVTKLQEFAIQRYGSILPCTWSSMEHICEHGLVQYFDWVYQTYHGGIQNLTTAAASWSHIELLKYLIRKRGELAMLSSVMYHASPEGDDYLDRMGVIPDPDRIRHISLPLMHHLIENKLLAGYYLKQHVALGWMGWMFTMLYNAEEFIWLIENAYQWMNRRDRNIMAAKKSISVCDAMLAKGYSLTTMVKIQIGNDNVELLDHLAKKGLLWKSHFRLLERSSKPRMRLLQSKYKDN